MKKGILFSFGVLIFGVVLLFNVSISEKSSNRNVSLKSLISSALATDENDPCPGGSCSYYESGWVYNPNTGKSEWKEKLVCTACCAATQNASCDWTGCSCM